MRNRGMALVPFFLASQALIAHWAAHGEKRPPIPEAAALPASIQGWERIAEIPADAVAAQLGADRVVQWSYRKLREESSAELLVVWFQSQRFGTAQPHSPLICVPGSGWNIDRKQTLTVATLAGAIPTTMLVTSQQGLNTVILYWYQTPFRVTPGEWESKLGLALDIFREKRTDIALVRVAASGEEQAAIKTATEFVRDAYPAIQAWLPR